MYVCMYSLCVCMYTCNACCEASTQTNILLLSLLLGGPNPFGGLVSVAGVQRHLFSFRRVVPEGSQEGDGNHHQERIPMNPRVNRPPQRKPPR